MATILHMVKLAWMRYVASVFLFFTGFCLNILAQTVSITTDMDDYWPGQWVIITGGGWQNNESVRLTLTHLDPLPDPIHSHESWDVIPDTLGRIYYEWFVENQELGTSLQLDAMGIPTGYTATTYFTDANCPVPTINSQPENQSVCAGDNAQFSVSATGTGALTYQWEEKRGTGNFSPIAGATSSTLSFNSVTALMNGYKYRCLVYNPSIGGCTPRPATTNDVTLTINSYVPSVSITSNPVTTTCQGVPVKFTATPVNGGTMPQYQWNKNGNPVGTNTSTYTDNSLQNGDIINCILTSNANCLQFASAASNNITMTVVPSVVPVVNISANPGNPICAGTSVTFTASTENSGSSPVYQWKRNGNNVGTNSNTYTSSALVNGDVISCVMNSNSPCASPVSATSNSIPVTVNPHPIGVISGTQTICNGNQALLSIALTGTGPWTGVLSNGLNFSGDTNPITVKVNPFTKTTYTITSLSDHYCQAQSRDLSGSAVVSVLDIPTATIEITGANPVCFGGNSSIKITGTPNATLIYTINGGSESTEILNGGGNATIAINNLTANTNFNLVSVSNSTCTTNYADKSVSLIVNTPPVLATIVDMSIDEEKKLEFTASASDDGFGVPVNTLSFSLAAPITGTFPAGAAINGATGVFTWTPDESQGSGIYRVKVVVSDGCTGIATDEEEIQITVNEVNLPPVLAAVGNQTVDEETTLTFTVSATDYDLNPANILTYSLVNAPEGAVINSATGVFKWTPTEAQGAGSFKFTVKVTDNGVNPASLSDEEEITVTVNEVNVAPVMATVGNQTVAEETTLTFTVSAVDPDLNPENILTYSLVNAPEGAFIDGVTGVFTWRPTEAQGAGSFTFTVKVTDNGVNPANLSDEEEITVTVSEVNVAPVLAAVGNQTVDEETTLTFTVSATDHDLNPANILTYSLVDAPAGAVLDGATGIFTWTPSEAQGAGSFKFKVKVTDNGENPASLTDEEEITVTVNEVNLPPVLASIGDKTTPWGNTLTFTATATDPDVPANTLTYSLAEAPAGAAINGSTGVFTWSPTEAQGAGSYTFKVKVTDNGVNPSNLTDYETMTVSVTKRKTALVYNGDLTEQYSDQTDLKATLTDITNGAPGTPITGKLISFNFTGATTVSASGNTITNGIASATLIITQAPGTSYTVSSSFAGDASYDPCNAATVSFTITQEDARINFTGTSLVATSSATSGSANITLRATVQDMTAVDPVNDPDAGDIRYSRVRFLNGSTPITATGTDAAGWIIPALVNSYDLKTGVVSLDWLVNIGTATDAEYTIGIEVSNYYVRKNSMDNTVITVYKPTGDFITGGGYIMPPKTSKPTGIYSSDPALGLRTNFGFNVKYNKNGTNLQGNMNFITRNTVGGIVHTYQIKANAMTSLGVNIADKTALNAVFVLKANLTHITNPLAPVSLGGNLKLQVGLTDAGEPGLNDQIAISLWDGSTLLYCSNWNGTDAVQTTLKGGNLVVHSGFSLNQALIAPTQNTTLVQEFNYGVKAYPNPFAEHVTFDLQMKTDSRVRLEIYNTSGMKIATIFDNNVIAYDRYRIEYSPVSVSSTLLLYRLIVDDKLVFTGKLIHK